ncbi:MAG: HEAT repeat domain-containing protein, partial [Planctomycetales bacterium]
MTTWQMLTNGNRIRQLAVLVAMFMLTGCTESAMRYQNQDALEDALKKIKLIREMTAPYGGHPTQIDTVALVGGLSATGSDPPPNAYRTLLLTEMQRRDVDDPGRVLKSPSTVLAIVKAELPAGIQKGETFDVEVFIPHDDLEATSLRDGVMYEARLAEHKVLGRQFREGKVVAVAKGPLLIDPLADPESEPAKLRRGMILGGGKALESRPLGLLIRPEYKDARLSQKMGAAINRRFHLNRRGIKEGVAKPKTDSYIELVMHPRYTNNLNRYMSVLRSIAIGETQTERPMRLQYLQRQLMDPMTAANAAVQLEAIGIAAKDELKKGISSTNPEVRFYAAEALAYLDDPDAAKPLARAAQSEPAFRALALTALGAMDEPAARDELVGLLHVDS